MKKITILFCLLMFQARTQTSAIISKNELGISIGIGFPAMRMVATEFSGLGYNSTAPINLTYERQAVLSQSGTITVGGMLAYKYTSLTIDKDLGKMWWSHKVVAARFVYRIAPFEKIENLEIYAGLTAGLRFYVWKIKEKVYPAMTDTLEVLDKRTLPTLGGFVGGSYELVKNIRGFLELGYDISYGRFGVAIRF